MFMLLFLHNDRNCSIRREKHKRVVHMTCASHLKRSMMDFSLRRHFVREAIRVWNDMRASKRWQRSLVNCLNELLLSVYTIVLSPNATG